MGVGWGGLGVRRILHGTETLFRIFVVTSSVTTAKVYGLGVVQNSGKSRRMPQLQENCQKPIRRAFHKLMICRKYNRQSGWEQKKITLQTTNNMVENHSNFFLS